MGDIFKVEDSYTGLINQPYATAALSVKHRIIVLNGNAMTLTLPAVGSCAGMMYSFVYTYNPAPGTVSIATSGAGNEIIYGAAAPISGFALTLPGHYVCMYSDGTWWHVLYLENTV